jgi:hypothetical protein
MNLTSEERERLEDLLDRLVVDSLEAGERDQLNELLRCHEDAQQIYLDYLVVHASVAFRYSLQSTANVLNSILQEAEKNNKPLRSVQFMPHKVSPVRGIFHTIVTYPIVATLIVALLCYGSFALLAWNLRPEKLAIVANGSDGFVAVVQDVTNVHWSNDVSAKSIESSVLPGEPLTISSGTMELELKTGVKLIVEGPADWSVDGRNSVSLRSGKLLAHVPTQAIGFTVETPTARIVDLGTEFGVEVSDRGEAEVHVIQGRVVAEFVGTGEASGPRRVELRQSEAARFTTGEHEVVQYSVAADRFRRTTRTDAAVSAPSQKLLDGLQLWLRADRGVFAKFTDDDNSANDVPAMPGQRVQAWQDHSPHHRHAMQDNVEAQPVLAIGDAGAPVLRFQGEAWLERAGTVLEPGEPNRFTMIAAFKTTKPSKSTKSTSLQEQATIFGQFNSNRFAAANRFLGVEHGSQFEYDEYPPGGGYVRSPVGSVAYEATYVGGAVRNGRLREWFLLSPSDAASASDSLGEAYDLGLGGAPTLWRIGSRLSKAEPVGCFWGDLTELMIFDRPLGPSELKQIQDYLMAKSFPKKAP